MIEVDFVMEGKFDGIIHWCIGRRGYEDTMLFLTEPSARYRESFLEGLREFQREGIMLEYSVSRLSTDFDIYLRSVRADAERRFFPPDYVPSTRFWLIDGDEQHGLYVGNLTIRHRLNDILNKVGGHIGYQIRPSLRCRGYGKQLLQLGLQKAYELGLRRALLTCDETNIGSKKVIEYNGGQFENAVYVEGSPIKKLRYWIDLSTRDSSLHVDEKGA
jgi:predicted acetyltransferase